MDKKEIVCVWCDQIIKDTDFAGGGVKTQDGVVCGNCGDDAVECNDCEELTHEDCVRRIEGEVSKLICDNCYEDGDYSQCEGCGDYFHADQVDEDGYCRSCVQEDGEDEGDNRIQYRSIDLKTTKFQSEDTGTIITSPRTFGVELEIVNVDVQKLSELSHKLEKYIGVESDGTLHGGFGIEIQTPILKGGVGEKTLVDICAKSKECGFIVNKTCGTHIHLGAKDFIPEALPEQVDVENGEEIVGVMMRNSRILEKIKNLMAFYLVFDDIFLAMISESRRGNFYCKPLKNGYSLSEILMIRSQGDFDELWYKSKGGRGTNGGADRDDIKDRKEDGHDSTRYSGINFHSLLGRNGTLEIRYHGGTLDSKKILSWVSLHQHILDSVSSGKVKLDDVLTSQLKLKFGNKLKDFFQILQLPENLHAYVEGRINIYNK